MKKTKSIISIISAKSVTSIAFLCLLTVSLLSVMTSCAGNSSNNNNPSVSENSQNSDNQENPGNSEVAAETQNPRLDVADDIPDMDFNGKTFTILYPQWSMYNDYYFADEEIGEKMNDSVYRRTKNVEERLNIKINPVTKGYIETIQPTVTKSVKAGLDEYQSALTHCMSGVPELTSGGYVLDWNKIPVVDFSKPYWNQRMNETMSVDGVLLTAVSDFIIFDPNVIYFNKRIAKDLDVGSIYQTVKDGKWTWSKLAEYAKLASKDLDGNGVFDKNDQYGLVTHIGWMLESAVQSCGLYISKVGSDGYLVNNLNNERYGNLVNTLYELFYVGNQTFIGTWDANNPAGVYEAEVPMSSDRTLFIIDPLSTGKRYRAYDVEFGILPYPKYDEEQKDYLSLSWNGFIVIPATAEPELAGAVNEALAVESYKLTVPAYYDVLLTSKVARDTESTEMIDIIYKGAVYDFALDFGNWHQLTFSLENILASSKSPNWVSFLEKNETSFQKQMQKIYDNIRNNYVD